MLKGLVAGAVNLVLALSLGARLPTMPMLAAIGGVGFMGYGISLVLFVLALRDLGTARTGAYFSLAPFIGALLAILILGDHVTVQLAIAGSLMAFGLWLHLTERHEHRHMHEPMAHEHRHSHDARTSSASTRGGRRPRRVSLALASAQANAAPASPLS